MRSNFTDQTKTFDLVNGRGGGTFCKQRGTIIGAILSFEAVRRHAAHGNALLEARRAGTCEPRRIELRCRHGNMESQWYLERHVVHYADAPGKFHALYSHYMFPDRVESRSRAPVRGNYTLLLLVHWWGKRGIAGEEAIVLISASFHRCRVIALRLYLLSPCICLFPLFFFPFYFISHFSRIHTEWFDPIVDSIYLCAFARWYNYPRWTNATTGKNRFARPTVSTKEQRVWLGSMEYSQIVFSYNVYSAPGARISFPSGSRLCDATYCLFHYSLNWRPRDSLTLPALVLFYTRPR